MAEQSTGGKVIRDGIENQDGHAIYYDVTVDKDGVAHKVSIDMKSGQIVSSAVDDDDHERGARREDDHQRGQ